MITVLIVLLTIFVLCGLSCYYFFFHYLPKQFASGELVVEQNWLEFVLSIGVIIGIVICLLGEGLMSMFNYTQDNDET